MLPAQRCWQYFDNNWGQHGCAITQSMASSSLQHHRCTNLLCCTSCCCTIGWVQGHPAAASGGLRGAGGGPRVCGRHGEIAERAPTAAGRHIHHAGDLTEFRVQFPAKPFINGWLQPSVGRNGNMQWDTLPPRLLQHPS